MDPTTHEIRLNSWAELVRACQARPKGMSQKQWIAENSLSENQYYYWQRQVRKAMYIEGHSNLPEPDAADVPAVTFAELTTDTPKQPALSPASSEFHADAVIRTGLGVIGFANSISPELLHQIMEEVRHAE